MSAPLVLLIQPVRRVYVGISGTRTVIADTAKFSQNGRGKMKRGVEVGSKISH
jgi:hypothetical protein